MAIQIVLEQMHKRHRGLTPAVAGAYEEAASVCLSRHHTSPIQIVVGDNDVEATAGLAWTKPTSRTEDAWANAIDTTEAGAYCCVLAAVEQLRNLVALRRAETGTGADYYVGPRGAGLDDIEDLFRLEVSGVDRGDSKDVRRRFLEKTQQALRGESNLPAIAGVMGFAAQLLVTGDVPEKS